MPRGRLADALRRLPFERGPYCVQSPLHRLGLLLGKFMREEAAVQAKRVPPSSAAITCADEL